MKKFIEYRRNKRIAKREIAKLTATTLPVLNKLIDDNKRLAEIIGYISNLSIEQIQKIIADATVETIHKDEA